MKKILSPVVVVGLFAQFILSVAPPTVIAADNTGTMPHKFHVFIGTYTNGKSRGIYRAELDVATGKLSPAELAIEAANPSFLGIHPNQKWLYAVDREGDKQGGVIAYAIDRRTGKLSQIGKRAACESGPSHLVVDRAGKCVLVASYGTGTVAAVPIREDGGVADATCVIHHQGASVNQERQEAPHAHSINVDANNRIAVAADLGTDKLVLYNLDADHAQLTPHEPPFVAISPGGGPRHFAFHPNGKFGYANNELTNTVIAFAYDADKGTLTQLQEISTLPADFKDANTTSEILVHPSGRFLYVGNRGQNSIAMFQIDPTTGQLKMLGSESTQGKTPRNFAIDPTGSFLLAENQDSDTIIVFRINPETGKLQPTGQKIEVGAPACIKFVAVP